VIPAIGSNAANVNDGYVVLRACELRGGDGTDYDPAQGFPAAGAGAPALWAGNLVTVALFDCTLVGGDGGDGPTIVSPVFASGSGGAALHVEQSDVSVCSGVLTGGAEGADNDAQPSESGSAISVLFAFSDVRVLGALLESGPVQGAGTVAPLLDDPSRSVVLFDGVAGRVELPAQAREGETVLPQLGGEPGALVGLLASTRPKLLPLKGQKGTLVLDVAGLVGPFTLGPLPVPGGTLTVPFTLPALPAGVDALEVFVQGLFLEGGDSALGGVSALDWIDAAY